MESEVLEAPHYRSRRPPESSCNPSTRSEAHLGSHLSPARVPKPASDRAVEVEKERSKGGVEEIIGIGDIEEVNDDFYPILRPECA